MPTTYSAELSFARNYTLLKVLYTNDAKNTV